MKYKVISVANKNPMNPLKSIYMKLRIIQGNNVLPNELIPLNSCL